MALMVSDLHPRGKSGCSQMCPPFFGKLTCGHGRSTTFHKQVMELDGPCGHAPCSFSRSRHCGRRTWVWPNDPMISNDSIWFPGQNCVGKASEKGRGPLLAADFHSLGLRPVGRGYARASEQRQQNMLGLRIV